MLATAIELLTSGDFIPGFILGLLIVFATMVWTATTSRPVSIGGLLLSAGAFVALVPSVQEHLFLALGLILLAVAGTIPTRSMVTAVAVAIPGAIAVGISFLDSTLPALAGFVVLTIAVSAPLAASFNDRYATSTVATPLIAISFVGVLLTVPDTDEALKVTSAAIAWILAGPPAKAANLGRPGAYAATGMLIWAVASGGFARPGSLIVGVATLGLLIAEPVGRLVRSAGPTRLDRLTAGSPFVMLWVLAAQAGTVLVISQFAQFSGSNAVLAVILVVPVLVLAGWWATSSGPDE